jgi:hypothetical protein
MKLYSFFNPVVAIVANLIAISRITFMSKLLYLHIGNPHLFGSVLLAQVDAKFNNSFDEF